MDVLPNLVLDGTGHNMGSSHPPAYLDGEARKYWAKWHNTLVDTGTIHPTDEPQFELWCRNWSLLKSLDPKSDSKAAILFMALQKQFLAQSKAFGLTPEARAKQPKAEPVSEPDEFGIA